MPPYYNSVTSCIPTANIQHYTSCYACTTYQITTTSSYNYTTALKADADIKRFYDKGYITVKERDKLLERLSTISDITIMIKVDVDNRTIMFCTKALTSSTIVVYTPNNDVDFTINYDSKNDKFIIDSPTN